MIFSIITATFNSAETIEKTLDSLLYQINKEVEWIVIDGASSDETLSIIQHKFKGNLKCISEKDNGIYDALNKGICMSSGDIIGFLHSDDLFASNDIISQLVEIFNKEDVDGIYGDLQYIRKEDPAKVIRYWKSEQFHPQLLKRGWMPAHPTLFLKKEVYEKHGLFNLNYKIAADYDFMLRIFSDPALKFHYLPTIITKMKVGGASNRNLRNIKLKSSEDLKALKANKIRHPYLTLAYKNFSKLSQFLRK